MQENVQIEELSFEKALQQLEEIAQKMSDDSVELEALLELYQEGTRYLRHCRKKLSEAEAKLEQINQNMATQQETSSDGL